MSEPTDLARLTVHHERIRRLARALVRSEQESEDIVQDAWVLAIERGPRDPGALGAWLATVVRRLAGNGRRRDQRRRFRERESARPEALPSSADIAARVDVETRLAAALESLPEPHRTLLRDRYLGGLDAPAIAERDGRTPDSVHSSLKRARAALRRHLEKEGLGEDVHWTAALAPLLAPSSATAKTTTLIVGTLAMKKALAVLLVAVLGAATWWAQHDPAAGREYAMQNPTFGAAVIKSVPSTAKDALSEAGPEALAVLPEASARSLASAIPTGPSAATDWPVRVHFRNFDGGGFSGVPFRLSMYSGMQPVGEPMQSLSLVSGADGGVVLDLDDPGQSVCFTVDVEEDPRASLQVDEVYRAPLGTTSPLIEVFVFERDATITGSVLDANDHPVAGAYVEGKGGATITAGDGTFEVDVSSQAFGSLRAWADGNGETQVFVEDLAPGGTLEVELRLPPELVVSGTVRDPQGTPIAGAEVGVTGGSRRKAHSDAGGRYRLTSLAFQPGQTLRLSAKSDLHASESRDVDVEAGTPEIEVDFELARGIEVLGVVLAPDGTAVPGAEVWTGFDPRAWDRLVVYSDDEGRFRLDGAAAGTTHIGARVEAWPEIDRLMDLSDGQSITLQFEPTRTLRGIVQDEAGHPLSGIGVSAQRDGSYLDSNATTEDDGQFELTGFGSEGRFGVDVFGQGWIRTEVDVPESALDRDASDFVVTLSAAGSLSGAVTDAETGLPITGFTVRIGWPEWPGGRPDGAQAIDGVDSSWYRPGKTFNDEAGRWSTGSSDDLPPGRWAMVEVSAPGYAPLRLDAVQVAPVNEPSEESLAMVRPVTARVTVTSGGEPVADARIVGSTVAEPSAADLTWTATTGAAGVALLEGLPAGPLYVRIESDGRADWRAGPFEVSQAGSAISIELPPGFPLEVTVRDAAGEPLPGERVMLTGMDAGGSTGMREFAMTDDEGQVRFPRVTPGEWRVARAVGAGNYPRPDLPLDVAVGPSQGALSVLLQPKGIARVTVTFDELATTRDDTAVYLDIEDGRGRAALLRDSRAEFFGVMPGAYRITGSYWDPVAGQVVRFGGGFEVPSGAEEVEARGTTDG